MMIYTTHLMHQGNMQVGTRYKVALLLPKTILHDVCCIDWRGVFCSRVAGVEGR